MAIEESNLTHDASSKNEVFAAYHELLRKLKETQKAPTFQEEKIIEEKKQVIEVAIKETVTNDLARHLVNLRSSLNISLDEVEVQLLEERKKLARAKEAYDALYEKLEVQYQIEPIADSVAALQITYQEKSIELEQEINHRRQIWRREQEEFEGNLRNQQAQARSEQTREEEEYIHRRDMLRQKEQEQYDTRMRKELEEYESQRRNMEHELALKRLQMEEELRIREAQITSREHEFESLRDKIAQFPIEMQRVIDETEKNVNEKLKIKYEYEARLREKDFENERKAHQQTIEAYEAKIENAIATYEAKIAHLESLNYSFKTMSFVPQHSTDKLY